MHAHPQRDSDFTGGVEHVRIVQAQFVEEPLPFGPVIVGRGAKNDGPVAVGVSGAFSRGISVRQGAHHDARMLTTTVRPR